jgi:uncharacterized protein YjbJ (UPF0337 family)
MPTYTAMYDNRADAERVQSELRALGIIPTDDAAIHDRASAGYGDGAYDATASDRTTTTGEGHGFLASLKHMFGDDDSAVYDEGVKRGCFLLTVKTDDQNAQRVHDLLEKSNACDVDEKSTSWKNEGWTAPAAATGAAATGAMASDSYGAGQIARGPRVRGYTDGDRGALFGGRTIDTDNDGRGAGSEVRGAANETMGNIKQGVGSITGNESLRQSGEAQERTGEAQDGRGPDGGRI